MKKRLFAVLCACVVPSAFAYADMASFSIRSGDTLLGPWVVTLPEASSSPVSVVPHAGTSSPIEVSGESVLGALVGLDGEKDEFSLSDVQFYNFGEPHAGGLYVNCLTIPSSTSSPLCGNWQYSINGVAPFAGAGVTMLHANDTVFLYFGSPRHVSLSTVSVTVDAPFTAIAQAYDPATNTWAPATGVTIGVTQPDPNNPWSPIEIATSSVDVAGQAMFSIHATGTYAVGIKEDYYAPAETLVVVDVVPVAPPAEPVVFTPSGGGGYTHTQLNVPNALAYLTSKQQDDGSFGSPFLTDWTAIALASTDANETKTKLRNHLLASTPELSSVTDYERRAMALEAMGINPYSGTSIDYITHIAQSFDGTQIGDPSLYNDDIFAIFPLLHAGYTTNDDIIKKTTAFILSAQERGGSWDGSVDMTSAAMQALSLVQTLPDVSPALSRAENYVRSHQQSDGGFGGGNSFSTSWALQAISSLGQSPATWSTNVYNPNDYLETLQQQDGGVEPVTSPDQTRMWATAYAIPASLGKTWDSILQSFEKPVVVTVAESGGVTSASATTIARVIDESVATSTMPIATTTPVYVPVVYDDVASTTIDATVGVSVVQNEKKQQTKKTASSQVTRLVLEDEKVHQAPASSVQTQTQTASVAPVSNGIFARIWNAIASFFRNIF